ncbi:MAG: hypothetical protein U0992_04535 [Planctomycetaceae bacterium]
MTANEEKELAHRIDEGDQSTRDRMEVMASGWSSTSPGGMSARDCRCRTSSKGTGLLRGRGGSTPT